MKNTGEKWGSYGVKYMFVIYSSCCFLRILKLSFQNCEVWIDGWPFIRLSVYADDSLKVWWQIRPVLNLLIKRSCRPTYTRSRDSWIRHLTQSITLTGSEQIISPRKGLFNLTRLWIERRMFASHSSALTIGPLGMT